jgi:outer membrane protein OmpA-like peptidoglycan-associated protein
MNKSGRQSTLVIAALIALAAATSGCATKKYVSKQVSPVNQKLGQFEKKTDDRIAWLNNKEQNDISQVNERIATTDQKVSEVATAVQEAQGTASRAMEEVESNKSATTANAEAITKLESGVADALNYQLVEKTDVLFAFNKATLTNEAKTTLDGVASKFQSMPRGVIELAGFTDRVGSVNYNLTLSRQRAWAVQRYLVEHKVPSRCIHMVGLGKTAPPEGLESERQATSATSDRRQGRNPEERRVNIRIFGAGDISSASRSEP